MKQQTITVYRAEDFLFCNPENPEHVPIIKYSKTIGFIVGNLIKVCDKGSFVTAIPHPSRDWTMLVFGIYPVHGFLLKPVGVIKIHKS